MEDHDLDKRGYWVRSTLLNSIGTWSPKKCVEFLRLPESTQRQLRKCEKVSDAKAAVCDRLLHFLNAQEGKKFALPLILPCLEPGNAPIPLISAASAALVPISTFPEAQRNPPPLLTTVVGIAAKAPIPTSAPVPATPLCLPTVPAQMDPMSSTGLIPYSAPFPMAFCASIVQKKDPVAMGVILEAVGSESLSSPLIPYITAPLAQEAPTETGLIFPHLVTETVSMPLSPRVTPTPLPAHILQLFGVSNSPLEPGTTVLLKK